MSMKKLLLLMLAVVAGTMTAGAADEIVYLSYIKSTGQQAFNTGYTHKKNTLVELECMVEKDHQKNYEALFGSRLGDYQHNAFCFYSRFGGQDVPCINRTGQEVRGDAGDFPYNQRFVLTAQDKSASWDDPNDPSAGITISAFNATLDAGKNPLMLFDVNTSSTQGGVQAAGNRSVMTLYHCTIMENYFPVHDFWPAKKNGVVGLYDKKTGSFSGSITDTPFVAGEELGTEYSVSVQSNDGGTVEVDCVTSLKDEWVSFTVTWDDNHDFASAEVKDAQGNNVDCLERVSGTNIKIFQFKMPASNATIYVNFSEKQPVPEDAIVLLSYIRSTGQQAFNTNYIHTSTTMVEMGCVIEQDHQRDYEALFGARLTSYHNNAYCFFSRFAGKDVPCYNRSGVETQGSGLPYNRYIEVATMGQMAAWGTEDGLIGSVTTTGTADDGKTPMLIFNLNTATTPGGVKIDTSPCCMSLYKFKIYEGDYNLVHSFVPAKKNGEIGLYDRFTGSFSGSITDTPFLGGEETDVLYPVYVQHNEGGTVKAEFPAYSKESWGGFFITQNEGYEIKSIEVKDAEGNNLEYTLAKQEGLEGLYFFQMPASSVTVKVEFAKILTGDANADGTVDIADVVTVLNAMAGEEISGNADANSDGTVDIADVVTVLNIMAGADSGSSSSSAGTGDGTDVGGDDGDGGDKIYDVAEVPAEFPGGTSAMLQWLIDNMRYPQAALEEGIQGRVIVRFVVEKDGSLTNVEIMNSVDPSLNNEAIRLVQTMPKWTPASQNGQPVRYRTNIPIMFRIR